MPKKKKIDLNVYVRPAERQDIVYLVNWLQSDDYRSNNLTDYPVGNKRLLKDKLIKEISLANLVFARKQILVAEVNGERLAGMFFLNNIDWQSAHLDLQMYFPVEYRSTELPAINIAQVYDYIFGSLNMHKVYTHVLADNQAVIELHAKNNSKPEAVLPEYIYDGQNFHDIYVYATYKKEVFKK